jgi:hypothetical protein
MRSHTLGAITELMQLRFGWYRLMTGFLVQVDDRLQVGAWLMHFFMVQVEL